MYVRITLQFNQLSNLYWHAMPGMVKELALDWILFLLMKKLKFLDLVDLESSKQVVLFLISLLCRLGL